MEFKILYRIYFIYSGLLISYITKIRVFVPSTGHHCKLPDPPSSLGREHSQEKMVACGGKGSNDTLTSCHALTSSGTWERTTTLLERR